MDDYSKPIVAVIGAGLGGFVGCLVIVCLLWHCLRRSWCEKNDIPITKMNHLTLEEARRDTIITISSMNIGDESFDLQSGEQ